MPPKSKAQARYMRAVASGSIKKKGLSPAQAEEYVSGYSLKNLPERKKKSQSQSERDAIIRKKK